MIYIAMQPQGIFEEPTQLVSCPLPCHIVITGAQGDNKERDGGVSIVGSSMAEMATGRVRGQVLAMMFVVSECLLKVLCDSRGQTN